jgi:AraC-like DNA-binding protein
MGVICGLSGQENRTTVSASAMTKHTTPQPPSIRAGALAHFEVVAQYLGLAPSALLRRHGLDLAAVLQDPDAKLPATAVAAALEAAAAESGRADFGLLLAHAWSIADLGPVSLVVAHQDTLREALDTLALHRAHLSDAIAFDLHVDGAQAELRITLALPDDAASVQLADFTLGAALKVCRAILGASWLPLGARLTRGAPRDLSTCRRLLGTDAIVFGAEADALLLRPADLDLKLPRMPDPALRRHAEALIAKLPSTGDGSIAQRAASLVRAGLAEGRADLHHVAQALGLNSRTLQRRLRAEGLGFSDLLDQVRGELARSYLADRKTPLHVIAARLGYADGSAFTRWFTQTFGQPPSRWRDQAQSGQDQDGQDQNGQGPAEQRRSA